MKLQPRITIRDVPDSPVIENIINEKIQKLDQFYEHIMHCDVVVEQEQSSKYKGKLYAAKINLTVPGQELVVNHQRNEDVYVAIRDAFNAMRRQLQDFSRKRRGDKKSHDIALHGYIARLYPDEGFGIIEANGDEYYFSLTNVAYPDFEQLDAGMEVQFIPSEDGGTETAQAHRVSVGKHHMLGEES